MQHLKRYNQKIKPIEMETSLETLQRKQVIGKGLGVNPAICGLN